MNEKALNKIALKFYPEDNEFDFERSKYMDGWVDRNEEKRKAFKLGYLESEKQKSKIANNIYAEVDLILEEFGIKVIDRHRNIERIKKIIEK